MTAVVSLFGGVPPRFRAAALPPVLILHGDQDRVVPPGQAVALRKVCEDRKAPAEMKVYAGTGHMFLRDDNLLNILAVRDAERRVHRFLARRLQG